VFPHYLTMFDSYPAQGYRVDAFRRDLYSSACTLYVDLIIKFLPALIGHACAQ